MLTTGDKFKATSGERYRVQSCMPSGGQGTAYGVADDHGNQFVLKAYHEHFRTDDTRTRTRFLVDRQLAKHCPAICAPIDMVDDGRILGHIAPKAPGSPLEELLTNGGFDLVAGLQIGTAVAHAFAALHHMGIAHGDPHSNNVLVALEDDGAYTVNVIDLDNFSAAGLPDSPCLGQHFYMAPEIRSRSAGPSISTDRFGLAVLEHEIILLRHIAAGHDDDKSSFEAAMTGGKWLHDPAAIGSNPAGTIGGYPAGMLDARLARHFRSGISTDPTQRPAAAQWRDSLYNAMHNIIVCPSCGAPNLVDASKTFCPSCSKRYPVLGLEGAFGRVTLDTACTIVGRAQLGGSSKVSTRHAIIRRIGPEYRLQDSSANGTYRRANSGWIQLPKSDEVERQPLIQAGDVLRFADTEVRVVQL